MKQTARGFTIVELLIVIVVIAILAAIAVVAYGGIQQRARNNAKVAAAHQIAKQFDANTIKVGRHVPNAPVCLPIGNIDNNGDGVLDCGAIDHTSIRSEKAATNDFLSEHQLSNLKFPTEPIRNSSGNRFSGIQITFGSSNRGMNGVLQPYFLLFWLEGADQDCQSSYSVTPASSSDPLYMLEKGRNYGHSNNVTQCAFSLKEQSSV